VDSDVPHSVLSSPLLRHLVVCLAVSHEVRRNVRIQWVLWIAFHEQSADGKQKLRDGKRGAPVRLQDVHADLPLSVDVTMVNSGSKLHLQQMLEWEVEIQRKGREKT